MKGSERNAPCSCGSGVKAKRCDCRERARLAQLERERADREIRRRGEVQRRGGPSPLMLAALGALSGGWR